MTEFCIFLGGATFGIVAGMSLGVAMVQDGIHIKPLAATLRGRIHRLLHWRQWKKIREHYKSIDEMHDWKPPRCPYCGCVPGTVRRW